MTTMNEGLFTVLVVALVVLLTVPGAYMIYRNLRDTGAMAKRIDDLERQLQEERAEIARLHVEMARVSIRMERQAAYAQSLADIMRRNDMTVPPSPDELDEMASKATPLEKDNDYDTARLLRLMSRHFNIDELNDLAFQLRIETGDLGGESFNARARALIGNVQRNGRLSELVALCRQLRPNARF